MELSLEELEEFKKRRFRDAFKLAARLRGGTPRISRRGVEDVMRLAEAGRRTLNAYIEVVKWGRGERVLRLR